MAEPASLQLDPHAAVRAGDRTLTVRDPQDRSVVGVVPCASAADVARAVSAADMARSVISRMPAHERSEILGRAADAISIHAEELARLIATEGIKTIREARREVSRCRTTMQLCAEEARRLAGETIPFDQAVGGAGRVGWTTRVPAGIVAAITPFNDPLNLVAHKVGPAIAAGNAVVLKPHEQTPFSALRFAEILSGAGLPRDVLQVVTGIGAEAGAALVADPRVRVVSFTGGRAGGQAVAQLAGGVKHLMLELGGLCTTVVMNDADLASAIPAIGSGAFWAAGQNCLHVQHVLAQDDVHDAIAHGLTAHARALRVGDKQDPETDMGPVVSPTAAARIAADVAETVTAGGTLLTGGWHPTGTFYPPTILTNVPHHCRLAAEEVFGPVTVVERFSTYEQAVARVNRPGGGLQAAIFTRSLDTALNATRDFEVGAVIVNDSTDFRIDAMPFGGVGLAGLGREGVRQAAAAMSEVRLACINNPAGPGSGLAHRETP